MNEILIWENPTIDNRPRLREILMLGSAELARQLKSHEYGKAYIDFNRERELFEYVLRRRGGIWNYLLAKYGITKQVYKIRTWSKANLLAFAENRSFATLLIRWSPGEDDLKGLPIFSRKSEKLKFEIAFLQQFFYALGQNKYITDSVVQQTLAWCAEDKQEIGLDRKSVV